ncbi:hypothetical protein GSI_14621 [Ganoderma sinense ZZ0214-1]|uniref:Uncharacterized protein n=1 Tax=Ganoderma sinense ZZ0214-1 TaxID=1077348 RepID=A0A2G8RP71_9APHY|nr:hypothetical protein GSI_14621 [Ganoderma sinense ZZ0214-1]
MLRRPTLRVDPNAGQDSVVPATPSSPAELDYSHNSVFRSVQLEIHVRSPSVKIHRGANYDIRSLPVFGEQDKVSGQVLLDVSLCATPGRLTIFLSGSFLYTSPNMTQRDFDDYTESSRIDKNRHVFFMTSDSRTTGEFESPRSTTSLRDAFSASVRTRQRRPSQDRMRGALRPFQFAFDIPRPEQSGQELPPTFSSVATGECGPRARAGVERAEVSYSVTAVWEAADGSDRVLVEAPVIYEPDHGFRSLDGSAMEPESWLEIPLKPDRPLPFSCAVTLPHPAKFSRTSSISYFVVFTTNPRSTTLAREIAADATISVSLLRDIRIDSITPRYPPTPLSSTPSTSSDESDMPPVASRRLLKRVVKNPGSVVRGPTLKRITSQSRLSEVPSPSETRDKPLPQLPPPGMSETRALQTDVSIGFPKRPRYRCEPGRKHPSIEAHKSLPDGLYKGKIQLDKHLLPAFDWSGLRVKYYLEVSVIFGQDQVRARVPVRVT